jgi:hypothetical protein
MKKFMEFQVLETDEEKEDFYRQGWGHETVTFTIEELETFVRLLKEGKELGLFDGEYTHQFRLKRG